MTAEIKCSKCGKVHSLSESELTFSLPDDVFALSEKEREARGKVSEDVVILDEERIFVRGLLPLKVEGRAHVYNLGVWAAVPFSTFKRIYEFWDEAEQFKEPRMPGQLANKLPFHSDTVGLALQVQLMGKKSRPEFHIEPVEHSLYMEQSQGIDEHRALEYSDPVARRQSAVEQTIAADRRENAAPAER